VTDEREPTAEQRAHDELVSSIAHDLNNLLSSMLGYAGMLAVSLPPEAEGQEDVKQILQAGERAAALVRQLRASVQRDQ
jgi:signal transduction histidine kinase